MKHTRKGGCRYFLIGIGGISMSAIAKHLLSEGFDVSGSDMRAGDETGRLKALGARIFIGHSAEHIDGADVVIYNSAIKRDNPELAAAFGRGLKVYSRIEFLKKISETFSLSVGIAGCHGKTTATAMLANVLSVSDIGFLSHIGGEDRRLGNYFCNGKDVFLSEICEYNRNIDKFAVDYACLLNVALDHVDCYRDLDDIRKTYFDFLDRGKKKFLNADDPNSKGYVGEGVITFSANNKAADVCAHDLRLDGGASTFKIDIYGKDIEVRLKTIGKHNVYNALNTAAVAHELGISPDKIKVGLEKFEGVCRRFERMGEINGATVICDYAHHPEEIAATLETVNKIACGRIFVVFQPHTFTRTAVLMKDFVEVFRNLERVSIYKTYAAREKYAEEGSAKRLFDNIGTAENYFEEPEELLDHLKNNVRAGDIVLILGAGDLYDIVKTYL